MISEAIILAGGLGTRLKSRVAKLPKSMAPINGIPFLKYQLNYLAQFEIKTVYLAVGYLSEVITDYFGDSFLDMDINYSIEIEPLGTGGAILQALNETTTEEILILNGDTLFQIELNEYYQSHKASKADFSMALKPLNDFERYGVVKLNDDNTVIGFEEKQFQKQGTINGGVYILNKSALASYSFPLKFSFEREFLESKFTELHFNGYSSNGYFLDIGIPSDYDQAQEDFKNYDDWNIDKSWTLFLDRDGVINKKIKNGYVTSINEFEFIEGALESFPALNNHFGRIVVVTNQQCIGKGIIDEDKLNSIHDFMLTEIKKQGGKIDEIYFAPQLATENSEMRKPKTGMAKQAKEDFDEIDFNKSIIVGDSLTDMEFGQNMGMKTVFINPGLNGKFDKCFPTLKYFLKSIS
jgi:D-glycero-alpha-D-manno-heptose 1-phosphate guanylyltransferase